MSDQKTKPGKASVSAFINRVADEARRRDCRTLVRLMRDVTKARPRMWGDSIVGFGSYRYRYASGREGDWFLAGFAPRKKDLTVYLMAGLDRSRALVKRLGKCKTGKGCLYIRRLADVDAKVLRRLIEESVRHLRQSQP